jgi:four helix bundle protein
LAEQCYRLTGAFPRREIFGLSAQIRRAATSVPANIAEGYGRESAGSCVQFLRIAQGSLKELETHLILSERLGFLSPEANVSTRDRCSSVGKMLRSLIRSIQRTAGV